MIVIAMLIMNDMQAFFVVYGSNQSNFSHLRIRICWLSGKLWYLQHNSVRNTLVYNYDSKLFFALSNVFV